MTIGANSWRAVLFVAWLISMASDVDAQGRRVALVIGNSAYQHTSPLNNPRNDSDDVAEALGKFGFHVIKGRDLDKAGMDRTIRSFATALNGAELGLFFYAGHALQVGGINYLAPIDAQLSTSAALDFEMVRLDLVQRAMESETQANVILLDACRDNPLARNLRRSMGTRSTSVGQGLAQIEAGVGTLVSYSTQPGNVALDGEGQRNSPYAEALLRHVGRRGEDLLSVLIRVRNEVITATSGRQVPWDQHALRSQIYLAGTASAPAAQQPPVSKAPAQLPSASAANAAPTAQARHLPVPDAGAAGCATRGDVKYCASSVLPTEGVNSAHYGPRNLFDGDRGTAWVEGARSDGTGEWLVLSWPAPRHLVGLRIANGYGKTTSLFERNGRVGRVRLSFSDGKSIEADLRDVASVQNIAIDPPVTTQWVKLQILGVHRGSKYSDTAISELFPLFN